MSIKRSFLYFVIFSVTLVTCAKRMWFTILFKEVGDIKEGSPVILEDTKIGKVTNLELQKDEIAVEVQIFDQYKNRIKEKSAFYIIGSGEGAHILVEILDASSPPIKSGSIVKGSSEFKYWMKKGINELKSWVEKGVQKLEEFFESDEWKSFKEDIEKKLKEAEKKGKQELEQRLPEIKEKAKEFYQEVKKESPEVASKVKAYIDSLFSNAKRND